MATLTPINTINHNTIADGDKLQSDNNGILVNNDAAMLAESLTCNTDITKYRSTVQSNSANWNNNILRNFADIVVTQPDGTSTTLHGASNVKSVFSIQGSDDVTFVKNSNDTYSISTKQDVEQMSSYYADANTKFDTLMPNEICIFRSMWANAIQYGSTLCYTQYTQNANGLCLSLVPDHSWTTRSASDYNLERYVYPCNIFEREDLDGEYICQSVPKGGSIIWTTDTSFYGDSMSADAYSIALYTKASAYLKSISFKGGYASEQSIARGYADNGNALPEYVITAKNNSIGFCSSASNNSIAFNPKTDSVKQTRADDYSMCLMSDISNANIHNSAYAAVNTNKLKEANNSFVVNTYMYDNVTAQNKTFMLGNAFVGAGDGSVTYNITADNSFLIHEKQKDGRNIKYASSLCIGMKGCRYLGRSSDHSQCEYEDSVILYSHAGTQKYKSAFLLGAEEGYDSSVGGATKVDYTFEGLISLAGTVRTSNDYSRDVSYVKFTTPGLVIAGYGNNIVFGGSVVTSAVENCTVTMQLITTGSIGAGCNQCLCIKGAGSQVIKDHTTDSICINRGGVQANYVYSFGESTGFQPSSVNILRGTTYQSSNVTISNSIAMMESTTSGLNSLSLFNSYVDDMSTHTSLNKIEYGCALFNSSAHYYYSHDQVPIVNDMRLALWKNTLIKKDLLISQFDKIESINSLANLSNDTYYIVTG